jgi:microcystin-dependent protein
MDPFLAEIRVFPYHFAPRGWALCNGQLLQISQYTALFSIISTMYGGDGTRTFALPNLKGAVPLSQGQGPSLSDYQVGESGGAVSVTLSPSQMAAHSHGLNVSTRKANSREPGGELFALGDGISVYQVAQPPQAIFDPMMIGVAGGGSSHNNVQPYLTFNFCIALLGIFPHRGLGAETVLAVPHEGADVEVRSVSQPDGPPPIVFGPSEETEGL